MIGQTIFICVFKSVKGKRSGDPHNLVEHLTNMVKAMSILSSQVNLYPLCTI